MRPYVTNQDLARTLENLISRRDENLVRTYQAVVSYRFVNKKLHPEVAQMLFMPRKLMLGFVNICLFVILLCLVISLSPQWYFPFLVALFLVLQIASFLRNSLMAGRFMPYIYIDEMFSRNILVLCKKKPGK